MTMLARMDEMAAGGPVSLGGRLSALAASLLLGAALLLAPGAAWGQAEQCGTPDPSGAVTCADRAYATGISHRLDAGVASLSLTVGGGAATTVTATNNSTGISLFASTGGTITGDQTLTVGNVGAVAIVVGSGATPNRGIFLDQRGSGTARGDIRSGVTIGSQGAPMPTGISATARGAGGLSLTSAATIHATGFGLFLWRPAAGTTDSAATTLVNSGAITTSGDGIRVEYDTPAAATQTGLLTVTNSGAITVTGDGDGIRLADTGQGFNPYGDLMLTNSGAITASDADGDGIHVAFAEGNTASSGKITIDNSGAITANRYGIHVDNHGGGDIMLTNSDAGTIGSASYHAIYARARQGGDIDIDSSGDLSAAGAGMRAIMAQADGDGGVSVTASAGEIRSADGQGIYVQSDGTGGVTVESGADITTQSHGIQVRKSGASATAGDISITTSGGTIMVEGTSGSGIHVWDRYARKGSTTIVNAADITAFGEGIHIFGPDGERSSVRDRQEVGGDIIVTQMGGTVLSKWQSGIVARSKPFNDVGDVTVAAMGGTVQSAGWGTDAIRAIGRGRGDAIVTIAAGATAISLKGAGVLAVLSNQAREGAAANQVKIAMGGAILGRSGVSARVLYDASDETFEGSGETIAARSATARPVIDIAWTGRFGAGTTAQTAPNDDDRFFAPALGLALTYFLEVEADKASGGVYGGAAGIEAQAMDWRTEVGPEVAKGDDPGALDAAEQMNLLSETHADSRRAAILAQVKAVLGSAELDVQEAVFSAIKMGATGLDDLSDEEIADWLDDDNSGRRTLLRNVLAQSLSEAEKAVLRALAMGDGAGLNAALDDAEAGFTDGYKTAMRALLNRYHGGDIRIAMSAGEIVSRGDGIRAYYATANDDNGAIDITVGEGAEVSGARAGILVVNAGLNRVDLAKEDDDIRKQNVTVHGRVTGGSDAAVHLVGGGTLTVGEMGVLVAGAGRPAVLVNEAGRSVIHIAGEVRGGAGATEAMDLSGGGSVTVTETGRINTNANGAEAAIRVSGGTYEVAIYATGTALTKRGVDRAIARVRGGIVVATGGTVTDRENNRGRVSYAVVETVGDYTSGRYLPLELDADGEAVREGNAMYAALPDCPAGQVLRDDACVTQPPAEQRPGEGEPGGPGAPGGPGGPGVVGPMLPMNCDLTHGDCHLYEALPSALLAMNRLPSYGERMAAARNGNGGWARVESGRGEWRADTSILPGLAYDYDRNGVRAGIDMAMGESGRFGMAVHGLGGSAELAPSGGMGGGKIELAGLGVGANATAMAGDVYIDAQAAATWFAVDIASATGTELKQDARATGYALALEAGRAMAIGGGAISGGVTMTPRAGFAWSRVSLDDFVDARAARRVSLEDASSLTGRLGVGMATQTPGGMTVAASLDALREFSQESEVMFEGTRLKATSEATSVRLGLSAAHSWDEDRYGLQASAGYTAGAGDNSELAGGLSLSVRF